MLNDNLGPVLDDDTVTSETQTESAKAKEAGAISPKKDLVADISTYLNAPETFYRNYFDLEGGTYPDLFSRETSVKNDRSSTVKYLAVHRGAKLYSDLLTHVLTDRLKNSKEMDTEKRTKVISDLLQKFGPSAANVSIKDEGDKTK